jgi:GNAT superfamily N-acetyltransferase
MAVHGRLYDVAALFALVGVRAEQMVGALTYNIEDDSLEIVSCDAEPLRQGIGRRLVQAAVAEAKQVGVRSVWCTTTNDNLAALGFWQALGFRLKTLRCNAVEEARQLKPTIPLVAENGLPIRDELDLELPLDA